MYKCDGYVTISDLEDIIKTLIDQETIYKLAALDLIFDYLFLAVQKSLNLSYDELLQHFNYEYEYVTKYRK